MKIQPYFDRVLVKRQASDEKSSGGILIPGEAQEKSLFCQVVAVGHGYLDPATGNLVPLKTQVGDVILIGKWSGEETKVDGEDMLIVRESDIVGKVL